jgi:hypothetical protein
MRYGPRPRATRRPARPALAKAIDEIVQRFDGPSEPSPDDAWFKRAERKMREEASRRVKALKGAAEALQMTRDERGAHRPPSGVGGLSPLSVLFDASFRRVHGVPVKDHLDRLVAELLEAAQMLDSVAPRRKAGRTKDSFLHLLVREVAKACAHHGVMFKDSEHSEAAQILKDVCARVRWVGEHRSLSGWRRLLQLARDTQRGRLVGRHIE